MAVGGKDCPRQQRDSRELEKVPVRPWPELPWPPLFVLAPPVPPVSSDIRALPGGPACCSLGPVKINILMLPNQ